MSIFGEHNWYLLYSPWLSLARSLRVSKSIFMIMMKPFKIDLSWKMVYKHVPCQFWMNITCICNTHSWACRGHWGCSRRYDQHGTILNWFIFEKSYINMRHANFWCTYCTPHDWACRGRWGCPRAFSSFWDPSRSYSFQKNMEYHVLGFFMKNIVFHTYPGIVEYKHTV